MFYSRLSLCLLVFSAAYAQNQPGEQGIRQYQQSCAVCHGTDGTGGEFGPNISVRLPRLTNEQLVTVIHGGLSKRGMPAFPNVEGKTLEELIGFLRSLKPRWSPEVKRKIVTESGKSLEGVVMNQSSDDLELQTADNSIHLLRKKGDSFREVTSETNWDTYNGNVDGNRMTKLTQIDKANVASIAPRWMFTLPEVSGLETTPIVVNGIMYVTSVNECFALDAGNGRPLWHFQKPRRKELRVAIPANRGAAVAGDHLFMVTDDAHLIRLNRLTGSLDWDVEMADWRKNYFATSAPLVVGSLVISGTAGGESGARGFIAGFDQSTGKEVWRFWTVPGIGEPGAETWQGSNLEHGGAPAWFTGSYDSELDTLYWQTGNPGPDYNGNDRRGDNLYSDCLLALNPSTGKLKWYFQFTPHDTHDWDATEPVITANLEWQGQPRQLIFTANRNGFFYVLDRTNGKMLLAKQFVKKMNWATEIGKDGRPLLMKMESTSEGTTVCPSQDGATNWYSSSYLPSTGLFYLQTLEKCSVYSETKAEWQEGEGYLGGSQRPVHGEVPQKVLRALDPKTGSIAWELPQTGPAQSWGGTLATQTGLVFFAEDSGRFMAVDASSGKPLWSFDSNQYWKASPMAYEFDGHEYIAIASGQTVTAFGLPNESIANGSRLDSAPGQTH